MSLVMINIIAKKKIFSNLIGSKKVLLSYLDLLGTTVIKQLFQMFISPFLFCELPINVFWLFFYWGLNAFLIYLYNSLYGAFFVIVANVFLPFYSFPFSFVHDFMYIQFYIFYLNKCIKHFLLVVSFLSRKPDLYLHFSTCIFIVDFFFLTYTLVLLL